MINRKINMVIAGVLAASIAVSCIIFFKHRAPSYKQPATMDVFTPDPVLVSTAYSTLENSVKVHDHPSEFIHRTAASIAPTEIARDFRMELIALEAGLPCGMNLPVTLRDTPTRPNSHPVPGAISALSFMSKLQPLTIADNLVATIEEPQQPPEEDLLSPKEYWLEQQKPEDSQESSSNNGGGETSNKKPDPVKLIKRALTSSHTMEGYGGGMITPTAYMADCSTDDLIFSKPSVSFSFLRAGTNNITTFGISETIMGRVEVSYAMSRLGLGSLDRDIMRTMGRDIVRDDIYLHTFSVRGLLVKEDSCNMSLPAITAGVHFKYNDTIQTIDRRMGGGLKRIGLDKSNGVEYTLTATKTFNDPCLDRPLTISGGLRFSNAAQIGYLGFGNRCRLTFEGNVFYKPVDWLTLGYEIRQKRNPFRETGVFGEENWWHALTLRLNIGEQLSVTAMYGHLGNFINSSADCSWGVQLRWRF